ncbi:MAG: hypothetical protein JOZ57_01465, partial [Abitibacteriaceae bacterium]|nr:hypothetical protein [Abditibacteriaceae bacterium]
LVTAQRGEAEAHQGEAAAQRGEAQAQHRIVLAQHQLTAKQEQLTKTQQRLEGVNTRLSNARLRLASMQTQLEQTKTHVVTTKKAITNVLGDLRELTEKQANLQQRVKNQQVTVADLEGQRKVLEGKVQELQTAAQDAQAAASKYYRQAGEWFATSRELSNNKIIVAVNQLLAAQTIPANVTTTQALAALHQIVTAANAKVQQPPIGAQVMHLAPLNIDSGGQRLQLGEEEILNHLADYITTFEVPVSVRLMAAYNQVEGEKEISGRLMVVPVQPVFKADEPITDPITIDGTQSDARIFNQLLGLISEGEKAARAKGVMPPVSPDNPNFYALGTNERIFEALRRIQAIKGPARVRLLATDSLNTVEPLRVRIEVSRFEVSRP